MANPLLEAFGHIKEGATKVNQSPRKKEKDPSHRCEACCSRAEHGIAGFRVLVVTVRTKVTVVETEDDDGERTKHAGSHDDAVDNHVDEKFRCKYTVFELPNISKLYHQGNRNLH